MNSNTPHDPNAVAHKTDQTIDRALAALRDAYPRSGLNNRILASLDERAAHRATNPGGLPFRIAKGWGIVCGSKRESTFRLSHVALWAATSAAILTIASLAILHQHRISGGLQPAEYTPAHSRGTLAPASSYPDPVISSEGPRPESKNPETARRTTTPEPFSTANSARTVPRTAPEPGLTADSRPLNTDATTNEASAPGNLDAQALADLHAPSHPAPPLPLTAQEKLFYRMLRYGNATELAELNPVIRAQQDADETAAFKTFFPDPPPVQQPGDNE